MHLIVDTRGSFLSKHQGRLRVEKDRARLHEVPLLHLEQVLIVTTGVGLSSDVVQACCDAGIPIHFLTGKDGTEYGTLFSSGIGGTALTRREQLRAFDTERGLMLARAFASGKIQSRAALLRYTAKYRKDTDPALYTELLQTAREIQDGLPALARLSGPLDAAQRATLMGTEGRAAAQYWEMVGRLIPAHLDWPGRATRGATDPFNQALNYGYAVLRSQVRMALLLAGLDPHAGFLHADRPGKPSLTLDLIEEFRQAVVDRPVIGQVNRGMAIGQDADGMLDRDTRTRLAQRVLERLDSTDLYLSKRQPLRHILQLQARQIATFVRGERPTYEPFVMGW